MNSLLLLLTSYVLNVMWQAPVLAAVAWCLCRLVDRPEFQHKIWVATLVLATFTPVLPMLRASLVPESQAFNTIAATSPIPASAALTAMLTGPDLVLPPVAVYLISGLCTATFLFFALRLYWLLRRTNELVGNAQPLLLDPETEALWQRSKRAFSVPRAALYCSPDVTGPVTAGIFQPVVLVPLSFCENYSPTEFLAAVAHECAHIKRNDFGKSLLYEVCGLMTACHPVTWLVKSQIAHTREMICDRMAAEKLLDRNSYALALLQLATKMPPSGRPVLSHAVAASDSNVLEMRIMNLKTARPKTHIAKRCLAGMGASLTLLACAAVMASVTQSVAADTPAPSAKAQAGKVQKAAKSLSCTYWTPDNKALDGQCGFDKKDKKVYLCYSTADPTVSQLQIGCKDKLLDKK